MAYEKKWLNQKSASSILWVMMGFDTDNFLEYQYVCVDSQRLASFYEFIGEVHSKVPGEFLAFFARIQHALNILDVTMRVHGGFLVGETGVYTQAGFKPIFDNIHIDGYHFSG